jgi:hypothetical protein
MNRKKGGIEKGNDIFEASVPRNQILPTLEKI